MEDKPNRGIVLASRPSGAPKPENFRLEETAKLVPSSGQVLLRNLYLSLDPYMRGRMSEGPSYAAPTEIGAVMGGGTVARVETSKIDAFREGDLVVAFGGWQDYALSDGQGLTRIDPDMAHPSHALGVLGMTSFTAWHGLLKIGEPKAGETVVVASASGAVGSIVGQIAKLKGCRVVGIAGGKDKCTSVTDELGFDACIDRHDPAFDASLKDAVPNGIDIYFENVGGAVFDAVLPLLNDHARIPLCGLIATYNAKGLPDGPDRMSLLARTLLTKRIRMQGFIISDFYAASWFCDPSAPWQKGTVENTNKRIRRYLPGSTDLAVVSQRDLLHLTRHLNDQPRKCLGYRTPTEVFMAHLHEDR